MKDKDDISERLLLQRVRNRITEVLDIASDIEAHYRFGGDEIINLWEDWVDEYRLNRYIEPVFSKSEQTAIKDFHRIWLYVCENTPQILPPVEELSRSDLWLQLIAIAQDSLSIMNERGKFSEETELTDDELSQ
ncbi:hypothetical protein [Leptospira andrefontaineae]|uniref:Uncharacterized protein n=1 Tax=Leptospira andrefontaineae TaxID=2484976 RepID=A0A4R9H7B4_9LEPT|nr:hypothetical protein [Leptospira andrefontaineae]TGK41523.1 hypothetical protein EHO65_08880 [Leptospira andrefontaineae]